MDTAIKVSVESNTTLINSNSPYDALGPGSDGLEVLVALQDGEPRVPDLDRVVLRLLAARRRGRHLLV